MQKHHTIILFTSFGASLLSIILIAMLVYLVLASKIVNGKLISRPIEQTNSTQTSTEEHTNTSTSDEQEYLFSGVVSETGERTYRINTPLSASTERVSIEVSYSEQTLFSAIDTTHPPLPGSSTSAVSATSADAIHVGDTVEVMTNIRITTETVSVAAKEIHQLQ